MSLAEINPQHKSGLNRLIDKIRLILPEVKRTHYYDRWNADHTKLIHLERDDQDQIYRAGLYSVKDHMLFRMFEIARSGDHDNPHYTLMIESVASRGKIVTQFADYNSDGNLSIHGSICVLQSESPDSFREKRLSEGYLRTSELYPRINFGETVKKFLFNAKSAEPNFGKQELVPYNADFGSEKPNLLI